VALPKNLEHGFMHELHRYTNKQKHTHTQTKAHTHTHTHTHPHKSYGDFFPKFEITFLFPNRKKGKRFGKFLIVVSSFWKKNEKEKRVFNTHSSY
jgi:hypothetical protein